MHYLCYVDGITCRLQDTQLVSNKMLIDPNSVTGDGKMTFHQHFIDGVGLSSEAKKLRTKIDEKAKKLKVNWAMLEFSMSTFAKNYRRVID